MCSFATQKRKVGCALSALPPPILQLTRSLVGINTHQDYFSFFLQSNLLWDGCYLYIHRKICGQAKQATRLRVGLPALSYLSGYYS